MPHIDLNADMGESFGRWRVGDDERLMPLISAANIACGFHAGDPHVIARTVRLAVESGAAIGAHVGLPDLVGFGRRWLTLRPGELRDLILYQAGAVRAFAEAAGARLAHVKPHSVLYTTIQRDAELAAETAAAVRELGADVLLYLAGPIGRQAAEAAGIGYISEGYVDIDYDAEGELILVRDDRDPDEVAGRAVRLVREGVVRSASGPDIEVEAASICLHGDAANAPDIARAVRAALADAGVTVARPERTS